MIEFKSIKFKSILIDIKFKSILLIEFYANF